MRKLPCRKETIILDQLFGLVMRLFCFVVLLNKSDLLLVIFNKWMWILMVIKILVVCFSKLFNSNDFVIC